MPAATKPPCHNRAPYTDPNAGWVDTEMDRLGFDGQGPTSRPIFRYRWPWFTDRCTVNDRADIGPGQTYAQAHGWDCSGCRWLPGGVR